MAGIGFELKKLFSEEEELPFANLRAIIFSIIVSVGRREIGRASCRERV